MPSPTHQTARIDLRLTPELKGLLAQAADQHGVTLAAFLKMTAKRYLLEHPTLPAADPTGSTPDTPPWDTPAFPKALALNPALYPDPVEVANAATIPAWTSFEDVCSNCRKLLDSSEYVIALDCPAYTIPLSLCRACAESKHVL